MRIIVSTLECLVCTFICLVCTFGCAPKPKAAAPPLSDDQPSASQSVAAAAPPAKLTADHAAKPGASLSVVPTSTPTTGASSASVVLFDSYHAHNFIYRGLVPGEYTYHRYVGLRRAAQLLERRGCEVRELIVGPLTAQSLADVQLVVLNLPSMDRPPWLTSELDAIEQFIRRGGGMIFITDHSNCYYHQYHLLPLWDRLGLIPTFETVCESSDACRITPSGPGWVLIRHFEKHPVTSDLHYIATQTGGRVSGDGTIAWSSELAWADNGVVPLYGEGGAGLFGDMSYSDSEERGPQGVVLARSIDKGRILVIADQNCIGDAYIAYADNWRLWLNACQWSGALHWKPADSAAIPAPGAASSGVHRSGTTELDQNVVQSETGNASKEITSIDRDEDQGTSGSFSEIIAQEPDRNRQPEMSNIAWQVHCWEPLTSGQFRWGGTDNEQFYNFWCWMNRWTWVSTGELLGRPSEFKAGRSLLLATDHDLDDARLIDRARQTLAEGGKFILLADDHNADSQQDTSDSQWAMRHWQRITGAQEQVAESAPQWFDQPIGHWDLKAGTGTLIAIPNANSLRNSGFSTPDVSPDAARTKWQAQLHRWLFAHP